MDDNTGQPPEPDDEAVGYRQPPRQHRFQPGKSGNPKGRPKKALGFKTEIAEVLNTKVGVPGQPGRMTVRKAAFLRQAQKALKEGDPRAAGIVINESHALEEREEARVAEAQAAALSAEDKALIAAALHRLARGNSDS